MSTVDTATGYRFGRRLTAAIAAAVLAGSGALALLAPVVATTTTAEAVTNGSAPSRSTQVLYAYTKDGETIDASAVFLVKDKFTRATWDTTQMQKAVLEITDPAGVVTKITKNYDGSAQKTLSVTALASSDGSGGVWRIRIYTLDSAGNISKVNGGINLTDGSTYWDLPAAQSANAIVNWTVVVKNASGTERTGRVWADRLDYQQDQQMGYNTRTDITTYDLSDTGVLYQSNFLGYMGIESYLTANDLGLGDANCEPTYRSWNITDDPKLAEDCSNANVYRLFLETPDSSMPTSARSYAGGTTWVYPAYVAATLGDPKLTQNKVTSYTGTITAKVNNQKGSVVFKIDTNGDGDYNDPEDVTIDAGDVDAGDNASVTWDGKDGNGNAVDVSQPINIKATLSNLGEIHFVRGDVEVSRNGIEVTQLIGPGPGSTNLSWNDEPLGTQCQWYNDQTGSTDTVDCAGTHTSSLSATNTDSTGGVHVWTGGSDQEGSWGDQRYIEDWTSFDTSSTSTLEVDGTTLVAPLEITKTDHRSVVSPGDALTYELTVENTSTDGIDETDGIVKDYVPDEITYVSCATGASDGCSYDATSRVITWTGVDIAAGDSTVLTYDATVNDDVAVPGEFTNYATVKATNGEDPTTTPEAGCSGDLCTSDTDITDTPSLSITKDDGVDVAEPNQTLTYTIVATNSASVDEPAALVTDTIPNEVEFASCGSDTTCVYDDATRTITWPRFALAAGESKTLTLMVTVDQGVPRPSEFTNFVTIVGENETPSDPTQLCEAPGCDSDTDTTVAPVLEVTKDDGVVTVEPGQTLTYQISGTNNGPGDAWDAIMVDTLPDEVTYVSSSASGVYDEATRTITWSGLVLSNGDTITRTVTVTVNADVPRPGEFTNFVTLTMGVTPPDPTQSCDAPSCASDTDNTVAVPDLSITKDDGVEVVAPNQELVYTITAVNSGTGDEPGATIVDSLPDEVSYLGSSDSGVYDAMTHTVTWDGVAIAAGQSVTRTIAVTVNDDVERPTEFTNYVVIAGEGDTPTDPADGCDAPLCAADTDKTVTTPDLPHTGVDTGLPGVGESPWWLAVVGAVVLGGAGVGAVVVQRRSRQA